MPDVFKGPNYVHNQKMIKIPDLVAKPAPEEELPLFEEIMEDSEAGLAEQPVKEPQPVKFEPALLTKAELMERYKTEIGEIMQEASVRAYRDACAAKKEEVQQCINRVDTILMDMQRVQEEYFEKFSTELKFMAVDIAETVMMTKIENDDLALRDLVLQAMGRIKNAEWLDIQLSDKLTGLIDTLREEIKGQQYGGRVSLSPKPMPIDSVRIDTQMGAVDASITRQTDRLREVFEGEVF